MGRMGGGMSTDEKDEAISFDDLRFIQVLSWKREIMPTAMSVDDGIQL
jgi:hypothetical protein